MRVKAWPAGLLAGALSTCQLGATTIVAGRDFLRALGGLSTCRAGETQSSASRSPTVAFLPARGLSTATAPSRAALRSRRAPPPLSFAHRTRKRPLESTMSAVVLLPGDAKSLAGADGLCLWLDMRTAVLPAAQTLRILYDDLRQREEALGRTPDDPNWTLGRVPNPVGALLYPAEPEERASEDMKALGGSLPCFRLSNDNNSVMEVSSGEVVGVGLDPVEDAGGGGGAMAAVAAAQQAGGSLVLLRGVRPSVWEDGDITTVLRIAASACEGSGKTLVVSVRSVGQLHDAAMAALAASQTTVLGGTGESSDKKSGVALLIEPVPELWEAGLLYL